MSHLDFGGSSSGKERLANHKVVGCSKAELQMEQVGEGEGRRVMTASPG